MEKRTPHCKLSLVKSLIQTGKVRSTLSALKGAATLGLDFNAVLQIVMELESKDFYKSMTTYSDHTVWQDVYRPTTSVGEVYLKFTVMKEVLIISFKELG